MTSQLSPFLEREWLNVVGGCCGTTDAHIRELAIAAAAARPRRPASRRRQVCYAGADLLRVEDTPKPILVGERANVVGSRAFNRLIASKQWDEAVDVALEQTRYGARIIDVCLQNADRDECADIAAFYERLTRVVRVPLMVDTTDVDALDPVDGQRDHVVLFVATAGAGVRERSAACYAAGEFVEAHALQALALETAEACAEWLHRRIRMEWGFPDPPATSVQDLFTSRYRGKRYSFGYPACPNLEDQRGIWKLLQPEEIGVSLTDGMMMDPEASVSGLVFHHPDCAYFAVESRSEREARA